ISQFWGYPRAMGAIFGALYLSAEPLSLDELATQACVTKGSVSTNVRALERMGMVHKQLRVGERKDYYIAETDFWTIAKSVLEQRSKGEFDSALRGVGEALNSVKSTAWKPDEAATAAFYQERLQAIADFFSRLDSIVAMVLQLDRLRLGGVEQLLGKAKRKGSK
ncbi:MAG: hypothetical protein GY953_57975, partial [bacterium]|nr:hypothetical protein [bacterium]